MLRGARRRGIEGQRERDCRQVCQDQVLGQVWDGEGSAKETTSLNITRLAQEVFKSKHAPHETKLKLALALNNGAAKAWLKANADAAPTAQKKEADELQMTLLLLQKALCTSDCRRDRGVRGPTAPCAHLG